MRRRTFLVGSLTALAGCGDDGSKPVTPSPTPEGTARGGSSPAGSIESFRTYLQNGGIGVERLRREGDVVTLRYVPAGNTSDELSAEIGTIAGGYLREVEAGWTVARLEATLLESGDPTARWHVRSEWVGEYRRGEITGEELSTRILDTLERLEGTASD